MKMRFCQPNCNPEDRRYFGASGFVDCLFRRFNGGSVSFQGRAQVVGSAT